MEYGKITTLFLKIDLRTLKLAILGSGGFLSVVNVGARIKVDSAQQIAIYFRWTSAFYHEKLELYRAMLVLFARMSDAATSAAILAGLSP
jgi:hypothetical protein